MSSLHNEQLLATSPNVVLIDTVGMFYPCDVNHSQHLMLYAFGSIIIVYNLQSNMKTFIKYHNTAVSSLNFIKHNNNNSELMFVSIDKSSQPMICLWNTKLQCIYNENIKTRPNFHTHSSHVSQLDESTFLILITSIDCNLLYSFDITTYIISFIHNININTNSYINAFRCFYTSSTPSCVFQTSNSLSFYSITNNDHNNNPLRLNANVSFQFNLRNHSLQLNTFYNVICVITEKGNALLYDSAGNSINVFTPLHNNEKYIAACFSNENIILSTNTTKIYCFSIKENKLNFYTDLFMYIKQHKINFQLRTAENCSGKVYRAENDFANMINDIEYISFNEHCDSLCMMCIDGSIMYVPLSNVVRNTRQLYNFTAVGNNVSLYTFNAKCGGELIAFPVESDYYGNNTSSPYVFISNSKDNKTYMNVYKVNYPNEKVVNYFIDVQGDSDSDNATNNYFTSITFHPHFNKYKYLYAGDTLGYLYIFDISDNNNIYLYTKHKVASLPITHLSLNITASLICIGLETGMNIICDITKNCEFCIRPNDHFLNPVELSQLKLKHQTTSYSYFFTKHPLYIIYRKSHNELELSSLTTSPLNVTQLNISKILSIQTNILDICAHISENYIICLTEIKQIIIMQISNGEVTAVIDLNSQCNDVLNISLDESGLYLLLMCEVVRKGRMLLVIEIGTGNIKESIICGINVVRCRFDSVGCRIGCVGENGELALWCVSYEMRKAIKNVREEMKVNKEFWEQYDIKYYIEGDKVGRYNDEYAQADVFGGGNNNGDGRYYPVQERRRVIEKDDVGIDVGVDNDVLVGNNRENYNRSMLGSGVNRKGHGYYNDGNSLQECYLRRRKHGRDVEGSDGNVGNNKMEMRFLRKSPAQEEVDKYNLNERVSKVNKTNMQKNITKPVVKTFSKQQQSITIPKPISSFRSSSNIICNQDPNIYATQNYNNKQKSKQPQHTITSSFPQHSQPQRSFPNLKQKIIADSSSQQQSNIRIQNIANAINQMVFNSSTPLPQQYHHSHNSFEPNQTIPLNNQPYSPPIQPNNNNSTQQINLKTENSQKYYINNKQPHLSNQHSSTTSIHNEPPTIKHTKKYPEPIDIDEDLQDNNTNTNISHHSKNNIVNVSHSSVGDSFSMMINTNNVNTQQKPSNTSLTDQIDYLYDNIYNFEKVHNIK